MSQKLQEAREYEKKVSREIPRGQRPSFHVTSLVGWANDPNGFSEFQGKYHLFYQYHPYSVQWGPMHWGHYQTQDFVKWEALPCAIAPDTVYDQEGCFSGSAVEWQGKHYLMYTGVRKDEVTGEIRQAQCVAVGDGVEYEKLAGNPVISGEALPAGSSLEDFRDPKIWREGDLFYAVVGSRSDDTSGQIGLFVSKDVEHWEFVTILDRCRNEYGKMWECPDFFQLDGKGVLLTSPQDMVAEGLEFHNGNGTICLIGSYDGENHRFIRESVAAIDYGMDFYAPQTLETSDGRRIMIGWLQSWDNNMTPPGYQWSGMMTLPRELHVREGKLIQTPVKEIENYYTSTVSYDCQASENFQRLEGIQGRVFDMTVELEKETCGNLEIRVAAGERFYTQLLYKRDANQFITDRTYSGLCRDYLSSRAMELPEEPGKLKLRVLMDRYSLEVFLNDGEKAMTSLVFGSPEGEEIYFKADGPFQVEFHEIQRDINGEVSL